MSSTYFYYNNSSTVRCRAQNCLKRANFNYKGKDQPLFCSSHQENGMMNIKSRKCLGQRIELVETSDSDSKMKLVRCGTIPTFNFSKFTECLYCAKCKLPGMINVKDKKCLIETCEIIPCFNFENESKGIYCTVHKKEGMVNIKNIKIKFNRKRKRTQELEKRDGDSEEEMNDDEIKRKRELEKELDYTSDEDEPKKKIQHIRFRKHFK
jgi:hypothetical protein